MLGSIVNFVKIVVVLAIVFVAITWFIGHAAMAGTWVGNFFSAIFTFFNSLISASPIS
ncbi:hypothetical protein [Saccharopolyspora taberi]|uniref:Uncharacterized protein n=1 Tax=Saccharopolyspora taberi TaxID=60895 RepID=A0ABN3VPP8_9PSEU